MILLDILITVIFIISGFALAKAIMEAEDDDQEVTMILVGIILVIVTCGFAVGVIMINNEEKKFRKQV